MPDDQHLSEEPDQDKELARQWERLDALAAKEGLTRAEMLMKLLDSPRAKQMIAEKRKQQ